MNRATDINPGADGFVCLHGILRTATVERAFADRVEIAYRLANGRVNIVSRPLAMGLLPWIERSALIFLPIVFIEDLTLVTWLRERAAEGVTRVYLVAEVSRRLELWAKLGHEIRYQKRLNPTDGGNP